MKTAKEFWISKFPDAEKDWQKTGHDDNFQVRMMEEYAKYYHEQQVNSVDLADVGGNEVALTCDCVNPSGGLYYTKGKPNCMTCLLPKS
jgi:hypothetical protein